MRVFRKGVILICCLALILLGCATNSQDKKHGMEAYYQALQATDPHKNEILQPGSEKEQAAIKRFTYLLAHFTEDTIKNNMREIYASNAYYRDSFTAKVGLENIETYFIEGARTTHQLAFDLRDVAVHDGNYFFRWITQVSLNGKEDDVIHLTGISHVRFDKEGLIIFEEDFWDAGVIYERMPIIGFFIRWLKKRM